MHAFHEKALHFTPKLVWLKISYLALFKIPIFAYYLLNIYVFISNLLFILVVGGLYK